MRNKYSLFACIILSLILIAYRFSPVRYHKDSSLVVTTWDALGYYLYLPSVFIYRDYKELAWFPDIDEKYEVSGGKVYQAQKAKNGNYFFKYLVGVAILESPFFFVAHGLAGSLGYEADGFSPPYQFAIISGAIIYGILGLFILRKVLLKYFNDMVTASTLLLVILATNIIQYISFDSAMSHSYIFPLYALVIYFTLKWHEKPSMLWASLTGATIGLATISRPTEAIMLFIPLLWGTQNKALSAEKWALVRQNKSHLAILVLFGFIAVLPQLIYWKSATGSFVYDVGSKWEFLTPHFRVLFGWENGWFIYTPITIFFIAGMFFLKPYPFRYSVIVFCLLNIYLIIAWSDWRYGATYSCRALSQSYPVFALPLASYISGIRLNKWRFIFIGISCYLVFVNLFQIEQYNKTILHYREMNRKYYFSIYLDPHPSPLDMSLIDTDERLCREQNYNSKVLWQADTSIEIAMKEYSNHTLFESELSMDASDEPDDDSWLKIEARIKTDSPSLWGCFINSELMTADSVKQNKIRMDNALSRPGFSNDYAFYVRIPSSFKPCRFKLYLSSSGDMKAEVEKISIRYLKKQE